MTSLELIIDLLIIALLIPTIIYAYSLNKSLNLLRQNQKSLAQLVSALNEATFKAENSIPKLKSATEHSSEGLKEVVDSAKELKNDLLFINERADSLADRLENVISTSRNIKTPTPNEEKQTENIVNDRAAAELELLKALRSIK
ncbi:MAG: hypothetical protein E7020_05410 [Alphaproteobacteria bacterium]|nr:hypothetical protein [Alphaproteobacteria bacterium]